MFQQKRCLKILRTIAEIDQFRNSNYGSKVGFVPTMGALHNGHISLMKKAQTENEFVMSSIFVNPKQFSPGEDLEKYPRVLEKDLELLKMNNIHAVFVPSLEEIYPQNLLCHIEPTEFNSIYEGMARSDFFRGVATIVCKLFNIVQPTNAYFGQKDISQCILVQQMVKDLNMKVNVVVCETLRESDGLAMSSRNVYLNPTERIKSIVLYRALSTGKSYFDQLIASKADLKRKSITKDEIIKQIQIVLNSEPAITKVEYISLASHYNMKELEEILLDETAGFVLSSAIRIGTVRLIDNVLVGSANNHILKKYT